MRPPWRGYARLARRRGLACFRPAPLHKQSRGTLCFAGCGRAVRRVQRGWELVLRSRVKTRRATRVAARRAPKVAHRPPEVAHRPSPRSTGRWAMPVVTHTGCQPPTAAWPSLHGRRCPDGHCDRQALVAILAQRRRPPSVKPLTVRPLALAQRHRLPPHVPPPLLPPPFPAPFSDSLF